MTAGQEAVRFLKPAGSAFIIFCTILFFAICIGSFREPIKGYVPPHGSEYYREHLTELNEELNINVIPHIGGIAKTEIGENAIEIYFSDSGYVVPRAALLRYFDKSLFVFHTPDSQEKE